jgi:hypothetical protein
MNSGEIRMAQSRKARTTSVMTPECSVAFRRFDFRVSHVRNRVHPSVLLLWALLIGGCGGPPKAQTTFLRSVDLVDMTDRMAQSFAVDEVISRG